MSGPGRHDERGGATVLAVACLGVVLLVGCALGVVGAMVVAHRRAQAGADLAALAAAQALARGADPCTAGAAVARANGGELAACVVQDRDVVVEVVVNGPHWLGQEADLGARSRAGPAP